MRPTSVYEQIADDLRTKIADGTLQPGAQLPTESELREQYGVSSRSTVRQGLMVLVNEGLIVPKRPKGYFVRRWQPMVYRPQSEFGKRPPEVDIFTHLINSDGSGRSAKQEIEVAIVQPPSAVQERLRTDEADSVALRRRTRFLDDKPYNLNDSYAPLDLVQGSEWMSPADVARGTNLVLAELGHELVQALDEIYIRMPRPEEVRRLDLGPGTPVAEHIVTTFDPDGTPVQVTVNVVPGDRHVIVYERRKPDGAEPQPRIPWGAP